MPHVRQQLREAAESRLTGLATTGTRVFKHHRALGPNDYPALRVTTMNERSEAVGGDCDVLVRTIELLVEAWAAGGDELEETLDTIAAETETAIGTDDTFGGLATHTTLTATEKRIDAEGRRRVGVLVMTFEASVTTGAGAPNTAA